MLTNTDVYMKQYEKWSMYLKKGWAVHYIRSAAPTDAASLNNRKCDVSGILTKSEN